MINLEVALKMRNLPDLQRRVAAREKLSAQEMADKYQPTATDYAAVVAWLRSVGIQVVRQDGGHLAVFARAPISLLETALGITFARISFDGSDSAGAITDPQVPAAIAPLLVGINGLQPAFHKRKHLIVGNTLTSASPPYTPGQIAQAYNASGLYGAGVTGVGQAVAIIIDTFPLQSDLTSFWQTYGISQSLNHVQFIQAVSGTLPARSGEETLDTEWSSSIAPGANIRVYATTSLADNDLDEAYGQVYSDASGNPGLGIHQMTMSYGGNEAYTSLSQVQTDDQYFSELSGIGVTIFASSGDDGSTPGPTANSGERGVLGVESPASDPFVTGVGGTSLVLNADGSVGSEIVWNNSYGASGGGTSRYFSRPAWQAGPGVAAGTMRLVPDLSCSADPNYGAAVIYNGSMTEYGGTSWSSPTVAGFCALINQAHADGGFGPLGLLDLQIYPLIGTTNFRDITSGNNATSRSNGLYAAGVGYDEATGIGTPLIQALTQTLSGSGTPPTDTPTLPWWAMTLFGGLLLFAGCASARIRVGLLSIPEIKHAG